jgi:hypothetical protein
VGFTILLWERVQPRCSPGNPSKSIGHECPPTKSGSNGEGFDDRSRVTASLQEGLQARCSWLA